VHAAVKRVSIVVALLALAAEPSDELIPRRERSQLELHPVLGDAPARGDDLAAAGESSRSIGFELLTWMKKRRVAQWREPRGVRVAAVGRCAMSRTLRTGPDERSRSPTKHAVEEHAVGILEHAEDGGIDRTGG
jgi:hypothetical protein